MENVFAATSEKVPGESSPVIIPVFRGSPGGFFSEVQFFLVHFVIQIAGITRKKATLNGCF